MLSAAHILAMDAKNLLDVVDSVRIRYPELFAFEHSSASTTYETSECIASMKNLNVNHMEVGDNSVTDNKSAMPAMNPCDDQVNKQQTYQNISKINQEPRTFGTQDEIYANGDQIGPENRTEGIYDNECILNQLKQNNDDEKKVNYAATEQTSNLSSLPPTKPILAAKPGITIQSWI